MKSGWHKKLVVLLMLSILVMNVGCTGENQVTEAVETQPIYFFDTVRGKLSEESLDPGFLELTDEDEKIKYILEALVAGPKITALPNLVEIPIRSVNHAGNIINIDFESRYNELTPTAHIALRAMLVYSLCELDFIDGINFSIEGKPMTGANGKEIGTVRKTDILTGTLDPNQATSKPVVTLYFADATDTKLVAEQRRIELNGNVSQEKARIEELIKGPQKQGLLATIPPETVVKDVTVKNGICQVDLAFDLKSKFFTSAESKNIMIYSIVNTLTESGKIDKVAFLVDGKKDIEFTKDIDLKETFVRNEKVIKKVTAGD